jgi:DNA-directed RNA polymerase subunit M/transcription elongation factor TFIIS
MKTESPFEGKLDKNLVNYSENTLDCEKIQQDTKITNYGILTLKNLTKESLESIYFQANHGEIKVPKGLKEDVCLKINPDKSYGIIVEYSQISQTCPNCGNNQVIHWVSTLSGKQAGIIQKRTVEHYRCMDCPHRWFEKR